MRWTPNMPERAPETTGLRAGARARTEAKTLLVSLLHIGHYGIGERGIDALSVRPADASGRREPTICVSVGGMSALLPGGAMGSPGTRSVSGGGARR